MVVEASSWSVNPALLHFYRYPSGVSVERIAGSLLRVVVEKFVSNGACTLLPVVGGFSTRITRIRLPLLAMDAATTGNFRFRLGSCAGGLLRAPLAAANLLKPTTKGPRLNR